MTNIREQAKAIIAGTIAGLGSLGAALAPDDGGVTTVTPLEWVIVAGAALAAYQAAYWTPQPVSMGRLSPGGARGFMANLRTGDLLDLAASRLSVEEAVKLAERVGEREDQERKLQ